MKEHRDSPERPVEKKAKITKNDNVLIKYNSLLKNYEVSKTSYLKEYKDYCDEYEINYEMSYKTARDHELKSVFKSMNKHLNEAPLVQ